MSKQVRFTEKSDSDSDPIESAFNDLPVDIPSDSRPLIQFYEAQNCKDRDSRVLANSPGFPHLPGPISVPGESQKPPTPPPHKTTKDIHVQAMDHRIICRAAEIRQLWGTYDDGDTNYSKPVAFNEYTYIETAIEKFENLHAEIMLLYPEGTKLPRSQECTNHDTFGELTEEILSTVDEVSFGRKSMFGWKGLLPKIEAVLAYLQGIRTGTYQVLQ